MKKPNSSNRKWRLQSHLQKAAFTIVELIFVIVILGILATTAKMNMPDNKLFNDINFITSKIKAKQIYALSYDNYDYENEIFEDNKTCIYINKDALNRDEKYQISSKTTITPNNLNICFDNLGRPYLNNLVNMPIELNISYKAKTKKFKIMPFSGAIVKSE
jgi:prepilin-type N-terminal cleavage/methylation domain-containing protein